MKKDVNINIIWTNLKVKLMHKVLKHIQNTQKNGYTKVESKTVHIH
jgi:hypothetical protein